MAAKFDYARMAATADTLITRFSQGLVTVERVTAEGERPPELPIWQPWEPEVTVRQYRLSATVRTVERKFVDGTLILVTDDQVTCSDKMTLVSVNGAPVAEEVVPFDATLLDTLKIDGKPYLVLKQAPTPGAGTKIVHKLIVRGGMVAAAPAPEVIYALNFGQNQNSMYIGQVI